MDYHYRHPYTYTIIGSCQCIVLVQHLWFFNFFFSKINTIQWGVRTACERCSPRCLTRMPVWETGTLSCVGNCLSSLSCAVANCRALLSKYVYLAEGISPDKGLEKLKKHLRKVQKPKAKGNVVKTKFSKCFQVPFVSQNWVTLVFPSDSDCVW